jgi:ABC-type multidrug transport system ATPase subunit
MRLNFIRAFQHDLRLLFLDEPTAGPGDLQAVLDHIAMSAFDLT